MLPVEPRLFTQMHALGGTGEGAAGGDVGHTYTFTLAPSSPAGRCAPHQRVRDPVPRDQRGPGAELPTRHGAPGGLPCAGGAGHPPRWLPHHRQCRVTPLRLPARQGEDTAQRPTFLPHCVGVLVTYTPLPVRDRPLPSLFFSPLLSQQLPLPPPLPLPAHHQVIASAPTYPPSLPPSSNSSLLLPPLHIIRLSTYPTSLLLSSRPPPPSPLPSGHRVSAHLPQDPPEDAAGTGGVPGGGIWWEVGGRWSGCAAGAGKIPGGTIWGDAGGAEVSRSRCIWRQRGRGPAGAG